MEQNEAIKDTVQHWCWYGDNLIHQKRMEKAIKTVNIGDIWSRTKRSKTQYNPTVVLVRTKGDNFINI